MEEFGHYKKHIKMDAKYLSLQKNISASLYNYGAFFIFKKALFHIVYHPTRCAENYSKKEPAFLLQIY